MFQFLVPILSYLFNLLLEQLPPDADLGDHLVDICLKILGKAVTLTNTDVDDDLFDAVQTAIRAKQA